MRSLARCLVSLVPLLAFAPGCQMLSSTRPVVVRAIDADTHKPIDDARVEVADPHGGPDLVQRTDKEGNSRVGVKGNGETGVVVKVSALGYVAEDQTVTAAALQAVEPESLFHHSKKPAEVTLELYKDDPRPTVELVVPNGYRGLIQVELRIPEDAPAAPGQRNFSYQVEPPSPLVISGPALFRRFAVPDFTAHYADGTALPNSAKDGATGLWLLKMDRGSFSFLIGTEFEYKQSKPDTSLDTYPKKQSGGKGRGGRRGGGGGGGGRRGGNTDPNASPPSDSQ
jgi:uncharacterized membrane protein YgcG